MSLPNPGFDDGGFDSGGFDTTAPTLQTTPSRERVSQEWYLCDRCGITYPAGKMLQQNGLYLCAGVDTKECWDKPGHAANLKDLDIPYERRPEPLPNRDEDL